jgi:hypothetical protein
VRFAISLARHGKVRPVPVPHVAEAVDEARALHDLLRANGRHGAAGIVQGERALARIERREWGQESPETGPASRIAPEKTRQ